MPIMQCKNKEGKSGYKFGESGACYTYTDEDSRKKAKQKAILQGTAISQNTGEKLELSKEDISDIEDKEITKLEPVIKDNSQHLLFGWAYVAKGKNNEQVIDHSGEFVKEEDFKDLETAIYGFNMAFRDSDIRHSCIAKGTLVESMVFTKEKMEKMGIPEGIVPIGVWVGFHFSDDEDWNEIRKMSSPMFSLFGSATKEIIEEVE